MGKSIPGNDNKYLKGDMNNRVTKETTIRKGKTTKFLLLFHFLLLFLFPVNSLAHAFVLHVRQSNSRVYLDWFFFSVVINTAIIIDMVIIRMCSVLYRGVEWTVE